MRFSHKHWWILTAVILVAVYAAAQFVPYPAHAHLLSIFGNGLQSLLLLVLTAILLRNGLASYGKTRYFWYFMALGTSLWFLSIVLWMWFEVVLKQPLSEPFFGDIFVFIHIVPMMAALSLHPHRLHSLRRFDFGSIDFAMLLLWWLYLYAFIVLPWQCVIREMDRYEYGFGVLYVIENAALLGGLLVLTLRVRGAWRSVYTKFLIAATIYTVGSQLANIALARQTYYTGCIWDLPLVLSMCVFIHMGLSSHKLNLQAVPESTPQSETTSVSRMAMFSVLSLPLIGTWGTYMGKTPTPVVLFRLKITAVALFVLPLFIFLKQHFLDRELVHLLASSQRNLGNLKRLQGQLVQSEKLASLGELVAGAAHQISNPLTAIIGYSDLLEQEYPSEDERGAWVKKIGQQARRTQELLKQMLKFSKQEPAEKLLIDLNRVVADSVELRMLDLDDDNIRIVQRLDPKLPHLWADSNQLLQVFFNVVGNAIDAMKVIGGGTLTITTCFENGAAVVEFADTGTGIADPQRIFDPFYTTKPVGKGAGLGLSAAYGIVTEHGGTIVCHNLPEGGASFLVRFPIIHPFGREETRFVHA